MNKNLLKIAAIVGLGALIAAGFYFYDLKKNGENDNPPFAVEKVELDPTQLPKGFPANLPIEPGAEILQNTEATTTDGRQESTRTMTTRKTVTAAVKVYLDFFTKLGWTAIPQQSSDPNKASALLRKDSDLLLITAVNDSATEQATIRLTLTEAAH